MGFFGEPEACQTSPPRFFCWKRVPSPAIGASLPHASLPLSEDFTPRPSGSGRGSAGELLSAHTLAHRFTYPGFVRKHTYLAEDIRCGGMFAHFPRALIKAPRCRCTVQRRGVGRHILISIFTVSRFISISSSHHHHQLSSSSQPWKTFQLTDIKKRNYGVGVVLNLPPLSLSFFFLYLIALTEGYYSWCSTWGIALKPSFTHTHAFSSPFGFICMAFHLDFASIDGLGEDKKKEDLCVIAFPLSLQCTIKIESTAARADKWVQCCHEQTCPSGLQTIAVGVNYSLHHHIYPEKRNRD